MKRNAELDFWTGVFRREDGRPGNGHFAALFQETFRLDAGFYAGKRMLDVGCGPAGSLEWATMASQRVGLDPLVGRYRELGLEEMNMDYIEGNSAAMPFPDDSFDVVSSFNSLDHVEDVRASIREIVRVLAPGGCVLLIVEVNHPPTVTEPVSLPWELTEWFAPELSPAWERRYESNGAGWFFETVFAQVDWAGDHLGPRPGILVARLDKPLAPSGC